MNILFGELTGNYLEDTLNNGGRVFEHDGRYFDYNIKMNEHDFVIHDTTGRGLPIGVNGFEELYRAVKVARHYAKALAKYAHVSDLVRDDEVLVCD